MKKEILESNPPLTDAVFDPPETRVVFRTALTTEAAPKDSSDAVSV